MPYGRHSSRSDNNQMSLVKLWRKMGASVLIISNVGKCADAIVGYAGLNFLVEIKDGKKPPSQRKLTPAEQKFHDTWKGVIEIIKNEEEAINLIGRMQDVSKSLLCRTPKSTVINRG